MTMKEIRKLEKLLAGRVERTSLMAADNGGCCLSVEWIGGGSSIFYSFDEVEENFRRADRQRESDRVLHQAELEFYEREYERLAAEREMDLSTAD